MEYTGKHAYHAGRAIKQNRAARPYFFFDNKGQRRSGPAMIQDANKCSHPNRVGLHKFHQLFYFTTFLFSKPKHLTNPKFCANI
jgi:hypothetical protein